MASKDPGKEDSMDNSIVHSFQNLRVLTSFDMDCLVQDLSLALEDTARTRKNKHGNDAGHSQQRRVKRKSKKRKSSNPTSNTLSTTANVSECSESSVDDALKEYVGSIPQLSDSDDLVLRGGTKALQTLDYSILKFSSQSISVAESDSYTENSPMRPSRRRRRFKRMAVDVQPDSEISIIDYLNEQRLKRLQTLKPKLKIQDHKLDMDSETLIPSNVASCHQIAAPSKEESTNLSGKRKRSVRNGSSFDCVIDEDGCSENSLAANKIESSVLETSSSSVGSNSCSDGDSIYTDGGRDGDDEQSDFYHESGPACGIQGIIPWWETDTAAGQEDPDPCITGDSKFNQILTGSLQHMSKKAQKNFLSRQKVKTRLGREIRLGRRRLKDRKPGDTLARFIQDREKWKDNSRQSSKTSSYQVAGDSFCTFRTRNKDHIHSSSNGCGSNSSQHVETKRRRKTPPTTPTDGAGEFVGGDAQPIPESNVGNRLLQAMGWDPGSGLGPHGLGITAPVTAFKRPGRKGFGLADSNQGNGSDSSKNTSSLNAFVPASSIGGS